MAARLGEWDVAITAAEEASRLADGARGTALGSRRRYGDRARRRDARRPDQKAERLAAQAEMVAEPVGANITMAFAQFGKVLAALATVAMPTRIDVADRLFDPGDPAYHPVISLLADRGSRRGCVARRPAGRCARHGRAGRGDRLATPRYDGSRSPSAMPGRCWPTPSAKQASASTRHSART